MLVLALMIAGCAVILGANQFAAKTAKYAIIAAAVLGIAPCALQCCCGVLPGADILRLPSASGRFLWLLAFAALALLGFFAWRRRAERAKARELWQRRNGT